MASLLNWENATKKSRGLVLFLSLRTNTERLLLPGRKTGLSPMQSSGKENLEKAAQQKLGNAVGQVPKAAL